MVLKKLLKKPVFLVVFWFVVIVDSDIADVLGYTYCLQVTFKTLFGMFVFGEW